VVAPGLTASERHCLGQLIRRFSEEPENLAVDSQIIHADLSAQHILYADGAVTGVLDWGEVSLGDPDYDFCYMYGEFGEAFAREVALQYGHPNIDRLIHKAHYFWLIDQVDAIAYGTGRITAVDEAAAWHTLRGLLNQRTNDI
jgi:aminoglycoside phosphotransferase (APT) family kinase protein